MKINDELIDKLSGLAKLNFEGEERENIKKDLSRMLEFVDKRNAVNTDGVEPLVYLTNEESLMRPDIAEETITREEALKNAPQKDSFYFKVPKVLKRGE